MSTITRRAFASGIALLPSLRFTAAEAQASVTPAEARAIAKAAYIYGFPWWTTIESSTPIGWIARTQNTRALESIWNSARLFTPADKAIQTPNSDTLTPSSARTCVPSQSCSLFRR